MSVARVAGVAVMAGSMFVCPQVLAQSSGELDIMQLPRLMHSPASTREQYISNVLRKFRRSAGADQILDASDVDLQTRRNNARTRASQVSSLLTHDLDGNGVVTRAEVELSLDTGPGQARYQKRRIEKILEADKNGDGTITVAEALQQGDAQVKRIQTRRARTTQQSQFLTIDPNNDSRLTVDELETIARKVFAHYDTNGDTVLSQAEKTRWTDDTRRVRRASRPNSAYRAAAKCKLPKPGANAKVILLGAYEAGSLASTSVAGLDRETETSTFYVAPGAAPLYVIASSFTANIWRFTGNVDRIERFVTYPGHQRGKAPGVGVVGLSKDRVTFLEAGACGRGFYRSGSGRARQAIAAMNTSLGRPVDTVIAAYTLPGAVLPTGEAAKKRRRQTVRLSDGKTIDLGPRGAWPTGHPNATARISNGTRAERSLKRFSPGGVVEVDVESVVTPGKSRAQVYDVLPQEAGLVQLMREEKLERLSDGMYLIKQPIARFPAGLNGAHSVKFMLGKGVPLPAGSPGHSCVVSEETGQTLSRRGRPCR